MDIIQEATQWNPAQWSQKIGLATLDQLPLLISLLTKEKDEKEWPQKLMATIAGLGDRAHLETVGKALTLDQADEIFKQAASEPELLNKLPPLLVGISPALFRDLLADMPQEQIATLKQEVFTEALQHHLKLLSQEIDNDLTEQYRLVEAKYQEIDTLDLLDIRKQDVEAMDSSLQALKINSEALIDEIAQALALAWNTGRTDLVSQLSQLKEQAQKLLLYIGRPDKGLWEILEIKLNRVFIDPTLPLNLNSLKNEDPCLEALARLGIWYSDDYWELGLLPDIARQTLETNDDEKERLQQQEQLFKAVQNNLERLGLLTVGDLKKATIFSKKGLKEYIQAHQDLLLT